MNEQSLKEIATDFQVEQKESIKLIRNTKGYNWEIKILEVNVDRLVEIDKELKLKFDNNNLEGGKS